MKHLPVDHLNSTNKWPRSDAEIKVKKLTAGDTKPVTPGQKRT